MKKLILSLAILGASLCHAQIDKSKYDAVNERFYDGLAVVKLNWKYGFINEKGEEVIPLKYDFAYSFSDTKDKDKALANLEKWVREFYAVAKIALEDKPQLLESVSKFVRS